MRITIAAATRLELIETEIRQSYKHNVDVLYTGVGLLSSAVSLAQYALAQQPHLIVQAGIAGSFDEERNLGDVVVVKSECLGDTGVEENGDWKDIFDLGLQEADAVPFSNGEMVNDWLDKYNVLQLPEVKSVTINQITTAPKRIHLLQAKYGAAIESMEGASLHYVCKLLGTPFLQLRAVSNYVGERDKSKWKIKEAVTNLNKTIITLLNNIA